MKVTSAAQIQKLPQKDPMKPSRIPDASVTPKKTHRRMLAASDTSSSSRMRVSLRSSFRWNATVTGWTSSRPSTLAMCTKTIQRYMTSGHADAVAAWALFEERPVPLTEILVGRPASTGEPRAREIEPTPEELNRTRLAEEAR